MPASGARAPETLVERGAPAQRRHDRWIDPDKIAVIYRQLVDHPETVHASEIDLRHPGDDLSF